MNKSNFLLWVLVLLLIVGVGYILTSDRPSSLGGVTVGNDYIATTTANMRITGAVASDRLVRRGWGTLGSVVITEAGTSRFAIFDATTTVNSIDHFATSTKMLAYFPASMVAGTYVFDVQYTDGLVVHFFTAGTGTSTMTYR